VKLLLAKESVDPNFKDDKYSLMPLSWAAESGKFTSTLRETRPNEKDDPSHSSVLSCGNPIPTDPSSGASMQCAKRWSEECRPSAVSTLALTLSHFSSRQSPSQKIFAAIVLPLEI